MRRFLYLEAEERNTKSNNTEDQHVHLIVMKSETFTKGGVYLRLDFGSGNQ